MTKELKDLQYFKFCTYGFLRNLRFFEAFLLLFLLEKGMSYSQIGILYAVKEIALNFFEIPSGIISDAWGRKYTLASSFIIFIVSFLVFYFSASFGLFVLAFILFGFADAFRTGIHKAMMTDYLEINGLIKHRTLYYGNTRAWSQRGLAVSSLIGGGIVFFAGNYQTIFLFTIIPYLASFGLLLSYPEVLNRAIKPKGNKRWSQVKGAWSSFVQTLKQPQVYAVVTNSASFTAYKQSIKDYLQPILVVAVGVLPLLTDIEAKRRNGLLIGLVFFVIYLLTSQASKMAGRVKKGQLRKGSLWSFVIGLSAGVLVGVFYQIEMWWLAVFGFTLVFIVENFRKPVVTSMVSEEVSTTVLGSVLSAQSQLRTIISALISLVLGFMSEYFGIGKAIIAVSLILTVVFMTIVSRQKRTKSI